MESHLDKMPTLLGLHFLSAGTADGDKSLYISLDEPEERVRQNARAVGFGLKDIAFLDLSPTPDYFAKAQSYMVRRDDPMGCKNVRCRKRFDVVGIQSVAFI